MLFYAIFLSSNFVYDKIAPQNFLFFYNFDDFVKLSNKSASK